MAARDKNLFNFVRGKNLLLIKETPFIFLATKTRGLGDAVAVRSQAQHWENDNHKPGHRVYPMAWAILKQKNALFLLTVSIGDAIAKGSKSRKMKGIWLKGETDPTLTFLTSCGTFDN